MKKIITISIALILVLPLQGQQLIKGWSDSIGLETFPYHPLLIEAGPQSFYWMGASYLGRSVDHPRLEGVISDYPRLEGVISDYANIYFLKYDDAGKSLGANYIRGSYDAINAFSFQGGMTIVSRTNSDVEVGQVVFPIGGASHQEFIVSFDDQCNYLKITGIWDLTANQYVYSKATMDKRTGDIYIYGYENEPMQVRDHGIIGENLGDYFYVIKYDRDLVLRGVYFAGFDMSSGEFGRFRNLVVTPDATGEVLITGIYNGDQTAILGELTIGNRVDDYGAFALKLDVMMQPRWVRDGETKGWDFNTGIFEGLAMENGDLVLAGITHTGYFGLFGTEVVFNGGVDMTNYFALRISPDGEMQWETPLALEAMNIYYGEKKGTSSESFSSNFRWDATEWNNEVLYISGMFMNDSFEVAGRFLEKAFFEGGFVVAADLNTGEERWGYGLSSTNLDLHGLDLDASGSISLLGSAGIDQQFEMLGAIAVPGDDNVFHLGLDYGGNPLWLNNAYLEGGTFGLSGTDLEVLPSGAVFSSLVKSQPTNLLIGGELLTTQFAYSSWLVSLKPDNTLGGMVSDLEGNPVSPGIVKAFKASASGAHPHVATVPVDEAGNYLFDGLYPGQYTLQVVADINTYPDELPTYLGDEASWETARYIPVAADTKAPFMDIQLVRVPQLREEDGGKGQVSGSVNYEEEDGGKKGTLARPVKGTSVILKGKKQQKKSTAEDEIIAQVTTDDNGQFIFDFVPDGEYTLIVDIPGLPMLEYHNVVIAGNQIISGLEYTVSPEGIYTYTGVGFAEPETEFLHVYPNPGNGMIRIDIPASGSYHVKVYNTVGQLVHGQEFLQGPGKGILDLTGHMDGIYLIRMEGAGPSVVTKYLKR